MNTVVYHGLGYVGLTGAVHFAQAGVQVVGYDPDQGVVDAINQGKPRAGDFLSYLEDVSYRNFFHATTDFASVVDQVVHIIAVPSERDGAPYMPIVFSCLKRLGQEVPVGSLIIVESTLMPGAIDMFLDQNIDVANRLKSGEIFLAVCPRRDWFADPTKNLSNIPRVVGGYDTSSTEIARRTLAHVTPNDLILKTTYQTAELTKALENALLHVPVMMLHELALAYPTLDVAEAARLASTHWRFTSMGTLYLGLGSGGRCVPLGSKYLTFGSPRSVQPSIIERALRVDNDFPGMVADIAFRRAQRKVEADRAPEALVLGAAYRPGFRDTGLSPGLRVAERLVAMGIRVGVHDPVFSEAEVSQFIPAGAHAALLSDIDSYDIVILATPHAEYVGLPFSVLWAPSDQVIVDGRGTWKSYKHQLEASSCDYVQVGTAGWATC